MGLVNRLRRFLSSVDPDEETLEREEDGLAERSEWALGRAEDGTHAGTIASETVDGGPDALEAPPAEAAD
jgi:hypothetical protein